LSVAAGEAPSPGFSVVMISPEAVLTAPCSAATLSRNACDAFF